MIEIKSPKEFPAGHQWLIIVFGQERTLIPGDERSRTNPGHGYPEHTVVTPTKTMMAVEGQEELSKELEELYKKDRLRGDILVLEVSRTVFVNVGLKIDLT